MVTTPPEVQATLDRLTAALADAAGDDLLGVALYGGLAKGRFTPGISDVNVLVVVRQAGLELLERLSGPLTGARREGRVSALVATPDDLREMGRLFPVKIADIKAAHRVLRGRVGVEDIAVDAGALKLRAQQELANAELRMRQLVVEHAADPGATWGAVAGDMPHLAVTLETVLRCQGVEPPADRAGVLRRAAELLGVPAGTMERFAALHRHEARPADDAVRATAAEYLRLLGVLRARLVDLPLAAGTPAPGAPGDTAPRRAAPAPRRLGDA